MIFRSAAQKQDLKRSFERLDRPFFAAGACHILAYAFIEQCASSGYRAVKIEPKSGHVGVHIVTQNDKFIFDYHGYVPIERYYQHHFSKMQRFFPGWDAELINVDESLISKAWCFENNHRMPSQFYRDPIPRTFKYLRRHQLPCLI